MQGPTEGIQILQVNRTHSVGPDGLNLRVLRKLADVPARPLSIMSHGEGAQQLEKGTLQSSLKRVKRTVQGPADQTASL